jgi:fluoroacetyl-CoA thioesterase
MAAFEVGMVGEVSRVVTSQDTAARVASGLVEAFSTPSLVSLMENASVAAIRPHLSEGETAVGIEVTIKHLAATPVGMRVRARAELVEVDGRRLKFKVEAWDDKEQIGEGYHVRAIVDAARFNNRLKQKFPNGA